MNWISVKNKKPPFDEFNVPDPVLVYTNQGDIDVAIYEAGKWYLNSAHVLAMLPDRYKVTHWMPLPEPPK